MNPVGAVAEMLRKRERREPRMRLSWWGLLWALPVYCVFRVGDGIVPETGSRWLNALAWAGYGLVCAVFFVRAERALQPTGRLDAGRSWSLARPLGWVTWFTVFVVVHQMTPTPGVAFVVAYLVVVVVDHVTTLREARRHLGRAT